MHKRRGVVLAMTVLGGLSVLMPWASVGKLSITGLNTAYDFVYVVAFGLLALVALTGSKEEPMPLLLNVMTVAVSTVPGWFAFDDLLQLGRNAGVGLYIALVSSIVLFTSGLWGVVLSIQAIEWTPQTVRKTAIGVSVAATSGIVTLLALMAFR